MRRIITTFMAALALTGAVPAAAAFAQADEPLIQFSSEDEQMNAAIAAARRSLPGFWRRFAAKDGRDFGVKAAFASAEGGREHLWFSNLKREGGKVTGVLDNQPRLVAGMARGDTITFNEDQISDWSYEKNGRMWGGFTLRVMLPHLPEAEAEELRAYLSPTPVEGDI